MGASIPQVGDLNGDGVKDIVTSDYFSNIHFFEGIDDKNYKAPAKFKMTDGSDLEIYGAAVNGSGINDGGVYGALTMNDWNEDGLIDILFTARHCPLIVYYNEGEDGAPIFGDHDTIKIGGEIFKDDRPALTIYDINLDGKKDIVFGRDKIVSYSVNVGTNDTPVFDELSDAMQNNGEAIHMKYGAGSVEAAPIHGETQVAVVDWNNDGYPDLLVAENTGWTIGGPLEYLFLFKGVPDVSEKLYDGNIVNNKKENNIKFDALNNCISVGEKIDKISIISLNGKIIKSVVTKGSCKNIALKGISKGSYILLSKSKDLQYSRKIVLE